MNHRNHLGHLTTVLLLLATISSGPTLAAAENRLFEIRTYTTHEGRLEALHKRFREHTNSIFVKHGMSLIGYWTPTEGPRIGEHADLHPGLSEQRSPRYGLESLSSRS